MVDTIELKKEAARHGYWFRRMKKLVADRDFEIKILKIEKQTILLSLNFYVNWGKLQGHKESDSEINRLRKVKDEYRTELLEQINENKLLTNRLNETLKKAIFYPDQLPKVTTPAIKTISNYDLTIFKKRELTICDLETYLDPFRPKSNPRKRKKKKRPAKRTKKKKLN